MATCSKTHLAYSVVLHSTTDTTTVRIIPRTTLGDCQPDLKHVSRVTCSATISLLLPPQRHDLSGFLLGALHHGSRLPSTHNPTATVLLSNRRFKSNICSTISFRQRQTITILRETNDCDDRSSGKHPISIAFRCLPHLAASTSPNSARDSRERSTVR